MLEHERETDHGLWSTDWVGHYETPDGECRECGRDLEAGYLCDDCDTVEVLAA